MLTVVKWKQIINKYVMELTGINDGDRKGKVSKSDISTAGTFLKDKEPLGKHCAFPPQGPGTKLSSRDIISLFHPGC